MGARTGRFIEFAVVLLSAATWFPAFAASPPASFPRWVEPEFRVNNAPTVWDPVGERLLLFRPPASGDPVQVWAFHRDASPQWQLLPTAGASPTFLVAGMAAAYDAERRRVIAVAPSLWSWSNLGETEVWSLALADAPRWERVVVAGVAPVARIGASVALHGSDRLLLFGGWSAPVPGIPGGPQLRNDTWLLDLGDDPAWTELTPSGPLPPPRRNGALAVDPGSRQAVLLGGEFLIYPSTNEAWVFSLDDTTWSPLAAEGDAPTNTLPHALAFDPMRGAFIAVTSGAEHVRTDLLTLGASPRWEALPLANAPVARSRGRAHLDALHDRLVLAGGFGPHVESLDHVWAVELGDGRTWENWTPGVLRPSARSFHAGVWIEATRSVAYLGGAIGTPNFGSLDPITDSKFWWLSLSGPTLTWSVPPIPELPELGPRSNPGLVHDTRRNRLVALVDAESYGPSCLNCNRAWSYELTGEPGWQRIEAAEPAPEVFLLGSFYDEPRDRMVAVSRAPYGDLEIWGLLLETPAHWVRLDSGAACPPARSSPLVALDTGGDRIVLYGGSAASTGWRLTDTWTFDLGGSGQWSELHTTGDPPWSFGVMCLDPLRNRMLVFSRPPYPSVDLSVYELPLSDLPEWRQLEPGGLAPRRLAHFPTVYDPRKDRVVIFGGSHVDVDGLPSTDHIWYLELGSPIVDVELAVNAGAWKQLDRSRGRARIHVAILSSKTFDARSVDPTTVRFGHASAIERPGEGARAADERDVNGDGLADLSFQFSANEIEHGVSSATATLTGRTFDGRRIEGVVRRVDTRSGPLTSGPAADANEASPPEAQPLHVGPNPARGVIYARFTPAGNSPVRLEVFDLAGRRIHVAETGAREAALGEATLRLPQEMVDGLYWIRLMRAGKAEMARIVVVR